MTFTRTIVKRNEVFGGINVEFGTISNDGTTGTITFGQMNELFILIPVNIDNENAIQVSRATNVATVTTTSGDDFEYLAFGI